MKCLIDSKLSASLRLALCLAVAVFAGCKAAPCRYPTHIVIVDPEGVLRHPASGKALSTPKKGKQPTAEEFRSQFPRDVSGTAGEVRRPYFYWMWNDLKTNSTKTNIVIFIQGGLNTEQSGIDRANDCTEEILQDGAYPIFIAWNSDLIQSYLEHLVIVHRGKTAPAVQSSLVPLTIVADTGRLVAHAPLSLFEQAAAGVRTCASDGFTSNPETWRSQKEGKLFPEIRVNNDFSWLMTNGVSVTLGTNGAHTSFKVRGVAQTVKSVPNVLFESLVDTLGKLGWDQMLRRTKTMFTTPGEFDKGGVEIFTEELCDFLKENPDRHVILVGHSMGTIVANEMIRRHGNEMNLTHIVYLAAACGTEEFFRGVVPFLNTHPNVQFHNLCLHPANDSAETYYYFGRHSFWKAPIGLPSPDGSLLDWIDYYYSSTETDFGRTLGKWENCVPGMRGIIEQGALGNRATGQISIKAFGVGPRMQYGPQHHGDLGDIRYWDPRAWEPGFWDASLWDPVRLKTQ